MNTYFNAQKVHKFLHLIPTSNQGYGIEIPLKDSVAKKYPKENYRLTLSVYTTIREPALLRDQGFMFNHYDLEGFEQFNTVPIIALNVIYNDGETDQDEYMTIVEWDEEKLVLDYQPSSKIENNGKVLSLITNKYLQNHIKDILGLELHEVINKLELVRYTLSSSNFCRRVLNSYEINEKKYPLLMQNIFGGDEDNNRYFIKCLLENTLGVNHSFSKVYHKTTKEIDVYTDNTDAWDQGIWDVYVREKNQRKATKQDSFEDTMHIHFEDITKICLPGKYEVQYTYKCGKFRPGSVQQHFEVSIFYIGAIEKDMEIDGLQYRHDNIYKKLESILKLTLRSKIVNRI